MGRYSTDKGTIKTKRPSFSASHKNVVESDNAAKETRPVYSRTSVDNRLENCENAGEQSLPMQLRPGRKYTPVVGLSKKGLETDDKRKLESNDVINVETNSSSKSSDALLNKQSTFVAKAEHDCGIAQSRRKVASPTLTTSLGEKQPSRSPGISAPSDLPSNQTDASINSQNRKKYRSQNSWKTQQPPQRTPKFVHWRSTQRYLPKYSRFSQVKSSRRLSLLQRNSIMSLRPGRKYVSVFAKGRKNKEQQQTDYVCCHADTKYEKENCKHSETVQSSHDVLVENHVSDGACTSKTSVDDTTNNTDTNDTSTLIKTTCKLVKRRQNRHPVTGKFLKEDTSPRYCRYISPKRRKAKPRSVPGMLLRPNRKYISVFQKTCTSPVHSSVCPQTSDRSRKRNSVGKSQVFGTADLTTDAHEENWEDDSDSGNDSVLVAPETTSLEVEPKRKRVKRKYKAGQLGDTSHKLSVESGFVSQFGSGQRLEQTFELLGQNIERTVHKGLQNTDMGSSIHNECNSRSPVKEQHNFFPPREQKPTEPHKPARVPFTEEKCVTKANQAFKEIGRRKCAMNANCNVTTSSQETRTSTQNTSGNWQESGSCHQTCRPETDFAPKALMILRPYTNYRTEMNKPDCTQWFLIQGRNNCGAECEICPKEIQIGNQANESKLDTPQENCRADTSHKVPDEADKFQSIKTSSSISGENDTQIGGDHHVTPDVQDKEIHSGETVHPSHSSDVLGDYVPKTLMMLRPYSQYQSICGKTQVFHASCNHWLLVQGRQNELSSATNDSPPCQAEFDEHDNSDAQVKDVNCELGKEEADQTSVIIQSPENLTGSQISEDGSKTSHAIIEPQLVVESESFLDKDSHCSEPQPYDGITTNSKVEKVDITTKTVLKECNENKRLFECPETSKNTRIRTVHKSGNQAFSEYAPKTLMILRPYTAYRSPSKTTSHEHWLLTPTRDGGKVTVEVSHMGDEVHILSEQSNDEENELRSECLQTSRNPEVSLSKDDCMKLAETVPNLRTVEEMDSTHEDDCHEVDGDESFSPGSPVLEFVPSANEEHDSKCLEVSEYAPKTLMILRPYTAYQSSRSPHHACNSNTGHWLFNHTKDDCRGKVFDMNDGVISHGLVGKNKPNHHSEKTPSDKTVDSPNIKSTQLHLTKEPQAKISTKMPLAMSRKHRRCRSLFARTPRQITPSKNLAKTPQPSKLVTPLSVDGSGDSSHLQGNSKVQTPSFQIEESASSCSNLSGADIEKVSKQKRLHKVCLDIQVRGLSHWQQQTISADCDPNQPSSAAESVSAEKLDVSEKDLSETNPATEGTAVQSPEIGECAERKESPEQHELHTQIEKEPSQPISGDKHNEHAEDSPTSQTSVNKTTNATAKPNVHQTAFSNRQRTAMKLRKKDKHFLFSRLGFKQTKQKAVHLVEAGRHGREARTVKVHWKRRRALLKSSALVSAEPSVHKDISLQDVNSVLDPSKGSGEQVTGANKQEYTTGRRAKTVKVHWKRRQALLKSRATVLAEPSVHKDISPQDGNSVPDLSKGSSEQATKPECTKTVKVHWKKRQALLKRTETVSAEPSVDKETYLQDGESVPDLSKGSSEQATEATKLECTKTEKVHWKSRQALLKSTETVSAEPSVDKETYPQDGESVPDLSKGSGEQPTEANKPDYTKTVKVHWKRRQALLKSSETASAEPSVYKDISPQDGNSVPDSSEQATEASKPEYTCTTGRRAKTVKVHWKRRQALLKRSKMVSAEPDGHKDICPQDSNSVPDSSKGSSEQASEANKPDYTTGRKAKTVKVHWKRRRALLKSSATVSAEPSVHKDISLQDVNSVLDPSKGSSEQATEATKPECTKTVKVHWKKRQALLKSTETVSAEPSVDKETCPQDGESVPDLSKGSSEQPTEASKSKYTPPTLKSDNNFALPNDILNLLQPRKRGRPMKNRQRIGKKVNPEGCAVTPLKNIHPESNQISDKSGPSDDINLCRKGSNQTDDKQNICSTDSQGLLPDESVRLQNCKRSSTEDVSPRNYPLPPKKRYRPEKSDEKISENPSLSDSILSCGSTVFKEPKRHSDDNLSPRKAVLSPRKSSRLAKYKKRTYRNFSYKDLLSYKRNIPKTLKTNNDGNAIARNNIFPSLKRIRLAKYKHRLYRHSRLCIDGACAGPQRPEARSNGSRNSNQESCSWPPRKRGRPKVVSQKDGENANQKEEKPSSCDRINDAVGDGNSSPGTWSLPFRKRERPKKSAKPGNTCMSKSCDSFEEKSEKIVDVASGPRTCSFPPRKRGRPRRSENAKPEDTCRSPSCESLEKSETIGDVASGPEVCSLPPRKQGRPKRVENAKPDDTCRLPSCGDVKEKIRDDNSRPRSCIFPPRKRGRPAKFNQKSHKDPDSADVSFFFNAITRYIVNSATPISEDFALPFHKNSTKEDCNRLGREHVFPRPHKGKPKKRKRGARRFAPGKSLGLSTEDESLFPRQTLDNSHAMESGQRKLINLQQKKQDDRSGFRRHSNEILNDEILGSRSRQTRLKQQVQDSKANEVVSSSAPANTDLLPLAQRIRRLIPGYTGSSAEVFTLEEFCTLETLEEAVDRAAREARSEELQEWQLESNDLVSSSSKWKSRSKRSSRSPEGSYWDCSVCTYRNKAEAFKCAMCDVRKGTSTRKPRLNAQLVAQQQAQQNLSPLIHVKAVKATPRGPPQRKPGTSKKPRPRLKNVDRSSAISTEVVVNNVPVIITEYKEKAHTRTTTSSTATTETTANRTNGSVNGL